MKKCNALILIFLVCFLAGCVSIGRNTNDVYKTSSKENLPKTGISTQISPEFLKEELDILKAQLLSVHPAPFFRQSKVEFEAAFKRVRESLKYPLSKAEFYFQIAPLLAGLKDVHSFVNLPDNKQTEQKTTALFPLAVIVQNDRVFVAADLSDSPSVPIGAEILSINNAPVGHLLTMMRSVTSKETNTGQSRRIQLDFAWLLANMGHVGNDFQLEYFWQSQLVKKQVKGLQLSAVSHNLEKKLSYYGFFNLTSSSALLWLNDFNENPEVFDAFLNDKFKQMSQQQIRHLIIDVRYNHGGISENLKNLLSRLTEKPIHWAKQGIIKISEKLKRNHINKTRKRRESKYNWGLQWLPFEWTDQLQHSIWWADPGEKITLTLEAIKPNLEHTPKKVWVLTNGFCYSACSLFVASVNHYQLARTIGEKAGSLARHQFAYPVKIQLPHSGLYFTLPTMRFDFPAGEDSELISPQESVYRTVDDIARRIDPVLNKALREAEAEFSDNTYFEQE